jgi:HSP20 family protein
MAIVRWDPFADLRTLHSQVDDMFNQMFGGSSGVQAGPTTDIYTTNDNTMVVEAHLPNFTEQEVNVDVHQGALEIRAEHTEKQENTDKKKYLLRESSSSFYRHIALPERADDDHITANYKDGVLKVTIPFKELPKPKQIAIEGGGKKK